MGPAVPVAPTTCAALAARAVRATAVRPLSDVRRRHGGNADNVWETFGCSGAERTNADLRRHQPHQTPGQPFLERPAVEVLPRGIQRHDPAGMVDVPPAVAAAGGDLTKQGVLEGAAVSRRIDPGIRHRSGGARRVIPSHTPTMLAYCSRILGPASLLAYKGAEQPYSPVSLISTSAI